MGWSGWVRRGSPQVSEEREAVRPPPGDRFGPVGAVFGGGCCGGLARYAVTEAWPARAGGFPWAIFMINTTGTFALALLLVLLVEVVPPTRYLRPALGAGFLGSWTTFSALTTGTSELAAHRHPGTGAAYLVATAAAGLAAAVIGLLLGRSVTAYRRRRRPAGGR
jgi:CrcB protein